jgi:hypothetical protein
MEHSLLAAFFGCRHGRTTFPLTPVRRGHALRAIEPARQTYITCLDCGAELPYDWDRMQRVKTPALAWSAGALRRIARPHRAALR